MKFRLIFISLALITNVIYSGDSSLDFDVTPRHTISVQPTAFLGYNTDYMISFNGGILIGYRKYSNSTRSIIYGAGPCVGIGKNEYDYGLEFGCGSLDYSGFGIGSLVVAVGKITDKNDNEKKSGSFVRMQGGTIAMFSAAVNVTYAKFDNDDRVSLGIGVGF